MGAVPESKSSLQPSEFRYGDDRTLHRTSAVDVELDAAGKVVAVWYRCMRLPFTESRVDADRAADMRASYGIDAPSKVKAIVFDVLPKPVTA